MSYETPSFLLRKGFGGRVAEALAKVGGLFIMPSGAGDLPCVARRANKGAVVNKASG
jgi:hypothetical protein